MTPRETVTRLLPRRENKHEEQMMQEQLGRKRAWRWLLLIAGGVFAFMAQVGTAVSALAPTAADNVKTRPQPPAYSADANPIIHRRVQYTGDIWMTISNDGSIGTNSGGINPDPIDMAILRITYGPSFEFPGGTEIDYLYNGSLWIGGIVGADTLVSQQRNSGSGDALEWNGYAQIQEGVPAGYPGECDGITRQMQQSYTTSFSDTLIHPTNVDGIAGRLHLPLGLEVVQTTHQSADNFTRRFIIYDYKITNISDRPVQSLWCGIFLDNDVFWRNVSGCTENRTSDDMGGILTTWPNPVNPIYSDSLMVAWAIDNDGDACGSPRFPRTSSRGAMGVRVLRGPTPESRVNFNWFGLEQSLDWGPRLATDQYEFGGGTGLPPGDAATYHVMSNNEIDYSQPFAAMDFSPEWQRPLVGPPGANVANGLDTRICLSSGPVSVLEPGQTVPFTVAFLGGSNVHRDPSNTLDPENPQNFIDRLDFGDLATNAWWAGFVWDNYGFDTNEDGYAGEAYPVVGPDTVYYTGDGCPDLAGPSPPPGPDSANSDLQLISRPGELTLRWSGRTIETNMDPLLRTVDFEGYKVYIVERNSPQDNPSAEDYSLIASWDRIDYRRLTYNGDLGVWELDSDPLTNDDWREFFNDPQFNAEQHTGPSLTTCYRYMDTTDAGQPVERCAYFAAQDVNHANTYVVSGQTEQNLIQQVDLRDTVIDDISYQYGVYELNLDGLLQSRHYFMTLTAFDFGDPFNNLEPLETSKGGIGSRVIGLPTYSADVVEDYTLRGAPFSDSVKVSVYPNPYKIAFEEDGRKTSYFEQGFEGRTGQSELNEQDRRIHFINIPDTCEINIYTLDGDLVRTLVHPDANLTGYSSKISWDLISRNTQAVTSGIYLYRVDSKLGSQVGKLVIIK